MIKRLIQLIKIIQMEKAVIDQLLFELNRDRMMVRYILYQPGC